MFKTRIAEPNDAAALVPLLQELGYEVTADFLTPKLRGLADGVTDRVVLALEGEAIVGLIGCSSLELLHVAGRLGRITVLVVASTHRRAGMGAALVAEAENYLRSIGCVRVEVTSREQRADAHAFYESLGYAQSSKRFVKAL